MRIAFYAPLKAPDHPVPSGDRRIARLLIQALRGVGHEVDVVSSFRSYSASPEPSCYQALRDGARREAEHVVAALSTRDSRPELWFTYHLYYKAPDWLGPSVSTALGIPYVAAEVSHAPKRARDSWRDFHRDAEAAIRSAAAVLCLTRHDMTCVEPLVLDASRRLFFLPPFLDPRPFAGIHATRQSEREKLGCALDIDAAGCWLLAVGMMRRNAKLESYRELAAALKNLGSKRWTLVVVGDGEARSEVEALFDGSLRGRVRFTGEQTFEELASIYTASDIFVWPAVGEAYGMALLEAAAAGLPAVAGAIGGVPDIVIDRKTGLLARPNDPLDFAAKVGRLIDSAPLRDELSRNARLFVIGERNLEMAQSVIARALAVAQDRR